MTVQFNCTVISVWTQYVPRNYVSKNVFFTSRELKKISHNCIPRGQLNYNVTCIRNAVLPKSDVILMYLNLMFKQHQGRGGWVADDAWKSNLNRHKRRLT